MRVGKVRGMAGPVLVQWLGFVLLLVGVSLLWSVAWALLVAGLGLLAAGALAERASLPGGAG